MSDNVRLWMGAFKSMSDTECGYATFVYNLCVEFEVCLQVEITFFFSGGIFFLVTKYSGGILSRRHFFLEAFFLGGIFFQEAFFPGFEISFGNILISSFYM